MIIAHKLSKIKGKLKIEKVELDNGAKIPPNTVWLDLIEPSVEEERFINKSLNIDAPTREEMDKIEVMSPFYKEDNAYFMTITAIHKINKEYPEGTALIFILHPRCLVTLRYARPRSFSGFSSRAMRHPPLCSNPETTFEGLVESVVNELADVLEKTGNDIDQLLVDVFEKPKNITNLSDSSKKNADKDEDLLESDYYTVMIKRVGQTGNLISKIRESLVSINRMIIFFSHIEDIKMAQKKEFRLRFRNISREIHSLTEYANFLAQRNSFLLDATLGMINLEQNMIIKVFTVAAAVFLPPTLIASAYGMNFKFMPELEWTFGYPFSILLMILSAVLPYYFFKKKGWL